MKKIAVVAICFFVLMTPSVFAQVVQPPFESVIVGDNSPSSGGSSSDAQEFSLSSPAYVNRVDLGLFAETGTPLGATCAFSITITDSLTSGGGVGTVFLQRNESVVIPVAGNAFPFSDSAFPTFFLPAGTYYLVFDSQEPCGSQNLTSILWAFNAQGSSKVGIVGDGFFCCWESAIIKVGINPPQLQKETFAFDLDGPILLPPPTGGGIGQIIRLVVGPVTPPPGGPVQAQLGFRDINGNAIGPSSTVTLNPGQIESLDLNVSQFSQLGQRKEVLPFIAQVPNAAGAASSPVQLSASVQILDALTGIGTTLNPIPPPGASVPALGPQVLAGLQTMRVNVVAFPPDPCVGQISFTDKNGNPIGSTMPVNLSPGSAISVDLNANTLGLRLGQSIEVQPIVTVVPPLAAAAVNSVCETSVEVFDHLTQRTESYQSSLAALPAVQSQQ